MNVRYRGFSVIPAFLLFFPGVERALLCRLLPPVLGVHREGIAAAQGCSCIGLPAEKEGVTELSANKGIYCGTSYVPLAEMTHTLPSDHLGSEGLYSFGKENSGFIQSHLGAFSF